MYEKTDKMYVDKYIHMYIYNGYHLLIIMKILKNGMEEFTFMCASDLLHKDLEKI